MKKSKPRYHEDREILADMYCAQRRARDIAKSADTLNQLAKDQSQLACETDDPSDAAMLRELADANRCKADKLYTQAKGLKEGRMKRLGEKLSELRTNILPGIIPDNTVEE